MKDENKWRICTHDFKDGDAGVFMSQRVLMIELAAYDTVVADNQKLKDANFNLKHEYDLLTVDTHKAGVEIERLKKEVEQRKSAFIAQQKMWKEDMDEARKTKESRDQLRTLCADLVKFLKKYKQSDESMIDADNLLADHRLKELLGDE